jgi:hypothetical protein
MSGQDALELEELCRKFPAFATPFILLAGYYQRTGDYRAEEAIQKAALRVHNRSWLSDFVNNKQTDSDTANPVFVTEEKNIPETAESDTSLSEIITEEGPAEKLNADIEVKPEADMTEIEEELIISVEAAGETEVEKTADFSVSSLFIPEDPEEWVFEEIETLSTGNEASILGFSETSNTDSESHSNTILSAATPDAGGIILPFTEEETAQLEIPAFEENTEAFITATAPYQIEQYYPNVQPDNQGMPTDFYSWLNNPAAATNEAEDEAEELQKSENNRIQQQSIIDRFIQSDPGVIRPKKDFFTPESAAKKSEHLPEHLATETLAKVYLQQGNVQGAILIYERLMLKFPEKNTYFADLIQKIQKENNP